MNELEKINKEFQYKLEEIDDEENQRYLIKEFSKKDERGQFLAEIRCMSKPILPKSQKSKTQYPYWYISSYSTNAETEMELPQNLRFNDKDTAFNFVIMVRKAYLSEIARRPLTEAANEYITLQARSLRERTKNTISTLHELQREKWSLLKLARQCGVEEATFYVDDSDLGKAIQELTEYKYNDTTFFSEACLYDLIGKDSARSVLCLLEQLLLLVAPDRAIKM
jgi:hypothetical protein